MSDEDRHDTLQSQPTLMGTGPPTDPGVDGPPAGRPPARSDPVIRAMTKQYGPGYDRTPLDDWEDVAAMPGPVGPPPTLDKGTKMGGYVVGRLLGSGGMASVYEAVSPKGEHVAIKVLHPRFGEKLEVVHRFFQEAQAMSKAQHPNVLRIIDLVIGWNHSPFIVMELLNGQDLAHFLHDKAPLSVSEAVGLAAQMCDAVISLHDQAIVHRDLKPENMFVVPSSKGGQIKLLDFGIAKFLNEDDAMLKTRVGSILGTAQYMAPEQARGDEIDYRVDIYAIGAILYQMLTRSPPFQSHDIVEVLRAQLESAPEAPNARLAALGGGHKPIPVVIESLVMRCLEKDRNQRIDSAAELKRRLLDAIAETGEVILPVDAGRPPVDTGRPPIDAGKRWPAEITAPTERAGPGPSALWWIIAAVLGVVALVLVLLFALTR